MLLSVLHYFCSHCVCVSFVFVLCCMILLLSIFAIKTIAKLERMRITKRRKEMTKAALLVAFFLLHVFLCFTVLLLLVKP